MMTKIFGGIVLKAVNMNLVVNTDVSLKKFTVKLKIELKEEPCIYNNFSKQLAISDIEGNFDALRKLLQSNNFYLYQEITSILSFIVVLFKNKA